MGNLITRVWNGGGHNYSRVHASEILLNEVQDDLDRQRDRVNVLNDTFHVDMKKIEKQCLDRNIQLKALMEMNIKDVENNYDIRIDTLESELNDLRKNINRVDSIKRKFDNLGMMLMSNSEPELFDLNMEPEICVEPPKSINLLDPTRISAFKPIKPFDIYNIEDKFNVNDETVVDSSILPTIHE